MLKAPPTKLNLRRFMTAAIAIITLASAFAAVAELGFSHSVTPGLVNRYTGLFGARAGGKIGNWQKFIQSLNSGGGPENQVMEQPRTLSRVNDFMNRVPWVSDLEHWRATDYWATPAEMIASDGGDCEDFVIAKYFALKELGMPTERLRFVYV